MTPPQEVKNQDHFAALFVKQDGKHNFIGSCFYFTHKGVNYLCTPEHVVRGWTGEFVAVPRGKEYPAELIRADASYDIAILSPKSLPAEITLTLSPNRQTPGNLPLYAYEYSTTEVKNGVFHLVPATRIGNCVRVIQMTDIYGNAGIDMLELSFPALRGASGAAVVEVRGAQMIAHGMIVANTERHLLPAHIETVLNQKNEILEERKYFLPQAVAVNTTHIIRITESL